MPSLTQLAGKGLTKLFIMGPSKSGKSSLEHILSASPYVKTLYETIKHNELIKNDGGGKDSSELLFENLFSQSEGKLLDEGYEVVTCTNPGSIFYSDYLIDMLPDTYFIVIKRDSKDVSPEIFTTEYKTENIHSSDANEISNYLDVYYLFLLQFPSTKMSWYQIENQHLLRILVLELMTKVHQQP